MKRNKLQRPPNSNKFNFKGSNKELEKLKNQETGALFRCSENMHTCMIRIYYEYEFILIIIIFYRFPKL